MAELFKIEGSVEEVVYHNSENGYTVFMLLSGGRLVTAVGSFGDLAEGENLTLYGNWTTHPTYGRQFKVDSYESKMPQTSAQLLKYLSSGMIKGLGPKTAVKLIERFGEESFDILENNPERLAEIKGITQKKALAIGEEYKKQFAIRGAMMRLEKYGITAAESVAIFKNLGANSADYVELNPYILCSNIRGFDFARCDEIAKQVPQTPQSSYRTQCALRYALTYNCYEGHTCLPREKLIEVARAMTSEDEDTINAELDNLIDIHNIIQNDVASRQIVALPKLERSERNAAQKLVMMSRFPPGDIPSPAEDIIKIEADTGVFYEEKQRLAIIEAASKGILILTGGPGTGKTTTVRGMISLFEKYDLEIALAAPTGRAAKRLGEVTGREAKTIHRLLEVEWGDDESQSFCKNVQNPLSADVVIIDEMSMVDCELFSALLDALRIGCRLVLVGDSDQLPSVGPGKVLHDLVNSGSFPVVRLTEIFRQARKSLIVMNAHSIVSGEMPELTRRDSDFFFLEKPTASETLALVTELVTDRLKKAYGYDPVNDIQVLCPSKKGGCGTQNLNNELQALLNPSDERKQEHRTEGRTFRVGDKVMQMKNNYDLVWQKDGESGEGIYNGDVGIIRSISHAAGEFSIDFDGRVCAYPTDKCGELELAYAVTVHKSQGSEFPAVIIPVIDTPSPLMYRNLLYTAVTRAKNLLIIVGDRERLAAMVENDKRIRRYSCLRYFISEELQ